MYIFEGVFQSEEMYKLGIFSALFHYTLNINFGLLDKIINSLDTRENTIFILIPIHPKIRLPRYKQSPLFNNRPETKAKIITGLLHKIMRRIRHKDLNP